MHFMADAMCSNIISNDNFVSDCGDEYCICCALGDNCMLLSLGDVLELLATLVTYCWDTCSFFDRTAP